MVTTLLASLGVFLLASSCQGPDDHQKSGSVTPKDEGEQERQIQREAFGDIHWASLSLGGDNYGYSGGGSMYSGEIVAVHLTRANWNTPFGLHGWYSEEGTIDFRVERILVGSPKKLLSVLSVPFFWAEKKEKPENVASWVDAGFSRWQARPQVGERLTLTLWSAGDHKKYISDAGGDGGPVAVRWPVGADDPEVIAFEDVGRFFDPQEVADRRSIFRKLCQSRFKSLREIAFQYGIYGNRGHREEHLIDYLQNTDADLLSEPEMVRITWQLGLAYIVRGWEGRASPRLQPVIANWFLNELSCLDSPRRCNAALLALAHKQDKNYGLDYRQMLAFFAVPGKDRLFKKLQAVAGSGQPELAGPARELLKELEHTQ